MFWRVYVIPLSSKDHTKSVVGSFGALREHDIPSSWSWM